MRISLMMLTAVALGVSASSMVRGEDGDQPNRAERREKLKERFDENKDG
jgi:hypothetical protein